MLERGWVILIENQVYTFEIDKNLYERIKAPFLWEARDNFPFWCK